MSVSQKIKKIREFKNLSQEDMASKLSVSLATYGKLEREEVELNMGRLEQIAKIFNMKVEDIITFDDKLVFNTFNKNGANLIHSNNCNVGGLSERERALYEENALLLKEKIAILELQLAMVKK